MNQRKPNKFRWYSLGLVMLLLAGCFIISTGTIFARYREELMLDQMYSVRAPEQLCLGTIELVSEETTGDDGETENTEATESVAMKESFVPSEGIRWEKESGVARLNFAVANGNAEDNYSERTQEFSLRLIGSLGIWNGTETAAVQLLLPSEETPETPLVITGTANKIEKDTPLYVAFGEGWVYTFLDEQGEEIRWKLEGGSLQFVSVTMTANTAGFVDPSLFQLQIVGKATKE